MAGVLGKGRKKPQEGIMRHFLAVTAASALTVAATAAPLVPRITSHDFNFGAWEQADVPFYNSNGANADTLTLLADGSDREVTAFWQVWPVGGTPLPIFNAAGDFGGDLALSLAFDGHDETGNPLDVSLTGSGNVDGADLTISGAIPALGIPYGVLVAIDINQASLYGYGGRSSFVLESLGTFVNVNPLLPGASGLLGQQAASRGNIDFVEMTLPSHYDPLTRLTTGVERDGGGYSGEAGLVPEPASLALIIVGLGLAARRR
jgi:hypothetical protein